METVVLSDDTAIPALGLAPFACDNAEEVSSAVATAIECGVRRFTAHELYGNAAAIGAALRQSKLPREQFWITVVLWTKGRNHQGVLDAYDAMLYELGINTADCAVLHACLNPSKFLDQWAALEQLKKDGKVRSIGVGRCSLPNLEDLLKQSQVMPAIYKGEIAPFARDEQALHYLLDNNVTLLTTNFARGLNEPPQAVVSQMAAEVGCSSWEVCLQWARQRQMLVSIGNLPRHQIELAVQQLQVPRFTLSAEQIAQLDALNERLETSDER